MKNEEDLSVYNPVGSELRRAQLKMLEILIVVAKICDKNNIPYWLSFGTLLGAVRHKGFIPWDDDLDIEVELKDYNKLLKLLEVELPGSMKLQTEKNEINYCFKYAKVRDSESIIHEEASKDFKERGVFIDIFPRESSIFIFKKTSGIILGNSLSYSKLSMYDYKRNTNFQKNIIRTRLLLSTIFIKIARVLSLFLPFKKLYISLDVVSFCVGVDRGDVFPLNEIHFEGHVFKCPANPDAYLKSNYGDYMKLPLPKNRIVHSTKIEFFND